MVALVALDQRQLLRRTVVDGFVLLARVALTAKRLDVRYRVRTARADGHYVIHSQQYPGAPTAQALVPILETERLPLISGKRAVTSPPLVVSNEDDIPDSLRVVLLPATPRLIPSIPVVLPPHLACCGDVFAARISISTLALCDALFVLLSVSPARGRSPLRILLTPILVTVHRGLVWIRYSPCNPAIFASGGKPIASACVTVKCVGRLSKITPATPFHGRV